MSSLLSPKTLKGGIVLLDPVSSAVQKIIPLQYNPEKISRSLQPQGPGEGSGQASAMRLVGPPVETYTIEAEIDATDFLEVEDRQTLEEGLQPALAVLEAIVYPKSSKLVANNKLAAAGSLEILPEESPLVLFIWSKNRVMPVLITEFSITEEAFDANLNPIRAAISLSLRVLNVNDLGFEHKGGNLYMAYHQQKEQLANKYTSGNLGTLGQNSI